MKRTKLMTIVISLLLIMALGVVFVTTALGSGENNYMTPLQALENLDLVDYMQKDATVPRSYAVYALLSVIGELDTALNSEDECSFSDVDNDFAPYIGYAEELGIILGDGGGVFAPDRPITLEEMLTMCLRALGHSPSPENVYILAESEMLYTYSAGDSLYFYLTADKLGEILWNMLSVNVGEESLTYAEMLVEIGILDATTYEEITAQVYYEFGETTNVLTGAVSGVETVEPVESVEPEDTTTPDSESESVSETEPPKPPKPPQVDTDDGWSGIWSP